jgi:hypothetical protein
MEVISFDAASTSPSLVVRWRAPSAEGNEVLSTVTPPVRTPPYEGAWTLYIRWVGKATFLAAIYFPRETRQTPETVGGSTVVDMVAL